MGLGPADIRHLAPARIPGGKIPVWSQPPCLSSKRRHDPDVSAVRPSFKEARSGANLDHARARRPCRYECDRVAIRRKGRLEILRRVVGDIDLLTAFYTAHVNVKVAIPVRRERKQA